MNNYMRRMNNNNVSGIKNVQTTATTSSSLLGNVTDNSSNCSHANTANQYNSVAVTRDQGTWYQNIDGANLAKKQQLYRNTNNNKNCNENLEREPHNAVWKSNDVSKTEQQKRIDSNSNSNRKFISNNVCDIIVVDIEDEQESLEEQNFTTPQKFIIDASMKYRQHTLHDTEHVVDKLNNNIDAANADDANNDVDLDDDDDDDDDSLASMETLSDNVSIWIDGEKHWVAGVDENTTCSDLIWALLNYQSGQHNQQQIHQREVAQAKNNHQEQLQLQQLHEQQQTTEHHMNDSDNKCRSSSNGFTTNLYADNKPNKYFPSDTIHTSLTTTNNTYHTTHTTATMTSTATTASINQSMPMNTKENSKLTENLYPVAAKKSTVSSSSTAVSPLRSLPLTLPLPPGITTATQLTTEYVIVKQYHHCEEYLDGSTKVFDVLPPRDGPHKKECELLLRHLGPAPAAVYNNNAATPQLSSLISTDKDSGMGSPVGSTRSAKFRRRKHKSSQWLAQANTLHPKLSRCTANERLMKIILAQDVTIQRQLSLLRDKELQITKIEVEKHRKRERELGKNYLLETYLNGLDEAECEPEIQDAVETFKDEPYERCLMTTGTRKFPELRRTEEITTAGVHETIQSKALLAKNYLCKEMEIIKKEKKKKQCVREKIRKQDYKNVTTSITQISDFKSKTNKDKDRDRDRDRDKEKLSNRQEVHHKNDDIVTTDNSEQEIALQIEWLEKVYTVNKQLQKEEELTAKLHAKVRKHQLRMAQQTQKEVQMEIDKLDDNLALQCGDIRKIEANLMQTNEQLQKKLYILERLSVDYLQEQQHSSDIDGIEDPHNAQHHLNDFSEHHLDDKRQVIENLKNSIDLQKMSLSDIKCSEEMKQLQQIIAKPSLKTNTLNNTSSSKEIAFKQTGYESVNPIQHSNQRHEYFNEYFNENCENITNALNTICLNSSNRQHLYHHHQQVIVTTSAITLPLTTITTTLAINTTAANVGTKTTMSTSSCMFIDKNMLSSLPVQNAKTIKKQMFHAQTATSQVTVTAAATATAAVIMATNANKFPKQQFQHKTQHMPTATASTILTSRPQTSHQIPTTIVILKHASSLPPPSPSQLPAPVTSSTASGSALVPAPATTSSSSPTPSLMAMNTVDISQLGTLV